MKKPRKPRKPTEPRYHLARVSDLVAYVSEDQDKVAKLEDFGRLCVDAARDRMINNLGIDEKVVRNEDLVLVGSQLFWDVHNAPEGALKYVHKNTANKVRRYHKSIETYRTKMKKYRINLALWEAWQLGKEKDKLTGKKMKLENQLKTVQKQLDEVEDKIASRIEEADGVEDAG